MSSNRWLVAAGLAVLLLVIASVAVGTGRRGETEFPTDSPEGAVQQYIRAVEQQDANALRALLSPQAQSRCELADIRNALRFPTERDLRVTLRDTKVNDDRAVVRVNVTESSGAQPFDSGTYDHEETFDLLRLDAKWLVDQPTWPVYCPPKGITSGPPPVPATPAAAPKSSASPSATPRPAGSTRP